MNHSESFSSQHHGVPQNTPSQPFPEPPLPHSEEVPFPPPIGQPFDFADVDCTGTSSAVACSSATSKPPAAYCPPHASSETQVPYQSPSGSTPTQTPPVPSYSAPQDMIPTSSGSVMINAYPSPTDSAQQNSFPPPTGSTPQNLYPSQTGSALQSLYPSPADSSPQSSYPPPAESTRVVSNPAEAVLSSAQRSSYPPPNTSPVYAPSISGSSASVYEKTSSSHTVLGYTPPAPQASQQFAPHPYAAYQTMPKPARGGGSGSVENWIGRNVIGIIASVLVFLGILFLGFLVVPSLGDSAKIVLMFLLSGVLVATGTALTIRKKNTFTNALLGCGCGCFFISIMLTHAFFHAISDIAAYALLLLWLAGILALVKIADSMLMSIIAHVGMVTSLCFAYYIGLSEDRLMLILVYHVLSVGMIIAGNIICCKKTLKYGLYASLGMSLIAVVIMYLYYLTTPPLSNTAQIVSVIAAFCIQLVGAFILSVIITRSTSSVSVGAARTILHLLNTALLFGVIYVATYLFPQLLTVAEYPGQTALWSNRIYIELLLPTITTTIIALAYLFICVFLQKQQQLSRTLSITSTLIASFYIIEILLSLYTLTLFDQVSLLHIPGLIIVSLALAISFRITKDEIYLWVSFGVLMSDCVLMLFGGYSALVATSSIVSGLIYLICLFAILLYLRTQLNEKMKTSLLIPFKLLMLGVGEASIIAIIYASQIPNSVAFLAITVALLILFVLKFDARDTIQGGFWLFMRIHELVLILSSSWVIAFRNEEWPLLLVLIGLALTSVALLSCTVIAISRAPRKAEALGVFPGIGLTVLVLASIGGMTSWFDEPYVLSLALMISALVCVIVGFVLRIKSLRLYGLILVLCCVLKLVTLDVVNAETLMRVVVFISGGLICFGISALYNYAVKRLDAFGGSNIMRPTQRMQ